MDRPERFDAAAIAEALRHRLAELIQRTENIEQDLRHPLDADSAEQAADLADDEALGAVDAALLEEIGDIRRTLLRIDQGQYGKCQNCGGAIAPARLAALPTASSCMACAEPIRPAR